MPLVGHVIFMVTASKSISVDITFFSMATVKKLKFAIEKTTKIYALEELYLIFSLLIFFSLIDAEASATERVILNTRKCVRFCVFIRYKLVFN